MLGRHQRGQHFDLQRGYFRKEANAIGHAALVCLQNVEHVAHQVECALLNTLGAEDNLVRVYPVWNDQGRLLVADRSAGKADGVGRYLRRVDDGKLRAEI
jgi:hypothetical protein